MTSHLALPLRRRLLTRLAAGLAATALPPASRAAARLRPTPAQTEGPFYPLQLGEDTDADLLVHGARQYSVGQACWVGGTVTDRAGTPLAKVKAGGRELLTTQLYVEGDPGNARDGLWRRLSSAEREAVTRPFLPGPDGLTCEFPIVVAL